MGRFAPCVVCNCKFKHGFIKVGGEGIAKSSGSPAAAVDLKRESQKRSGSRRISSSRDTTHVDDTVMHMFFLVKHFLSFFQQSKKTEKRRDEIQKKNGKI